jgi:hypothetical protein
MAYITITKKVEKTADDRYRLKVWVSETSDNIPKQVFLFERISPVPLRPVPENAFKKTCSYADMLLYPEDSPDTENPYFRLGQVDLLFTSYKQMSTYFTEHIHDAVQYLVNDIVGTNLATPVEEQSSLNG